MRVWKKRPNSYGIKVEITFDESAAMYSYGIKVEITFDESAAMYNHHTESVEALA